MVQTEAAKDATTVIQTTTTSVTPHPNIIALERVLQVACIFRNATYRYSIGCVI